MPRVDTKGEELYAIKGLPPSLLNLPPGCNFNPRCPYKQDICLQEVPPSHEVALGHHSACHFWEEVYGHERADSASR
jgi:oligopeptide/dipeptide ABC transporter ATP-binding protein